MPVEAAGIGIILHGVAHEQSSAVREVLPGGGGRCERNRSIGISNAIRPLFTSKGSLFQGGPKELGKGCGDSD
jgi:hypothetical protein